MPDQPDNIVPITPDARTAAEKFRAQHDRELLTILFTDLVDSTKLQSDLGNVEAARLTELHREIVRDELAKYDAREIEWAGDSCLAVFTRPSDAVVFALRMQAEHRRARESEGRLPLVRVGMHLGEIVVKKGDKKEDLFGLQVSEAARVMSVARGNQIFCTRAVFDNARGSLKGSAIEGVGDVIWVNYGAYMLKGSEEPVELCEVGSSEVAILKAPQPSDKVSPLVPGPTKRAPSRPGVPTWAFGMVAMALMGVIVYLFLGQRPAPTGSAPSDAPIRSLAVLPLDNLSEEGSHEFFADGMTEALTAELAKLSGVKVISRTSTMQYKNVTRPMREIAAELGVDALVEGSVYRVGNEVRITVQLIDGRSDVHLWAGSYTGTLENVLTLQGKVALAIAREIRIAVTPEEEARLTKSRPVNPEAYDAYVEGRARWFERTEPALLQAIELFERASTLDPEFALAYSGLADAHLMLGVWEYRPAHEAFPKAKAAAERAIELDDQLGEAHTSLGAVYDYWELDFDAAGREFRRGLELNPDYSTGHQWYGYHLMGTGRFEESLSELEAAIELDPFAGIHRGGKGLIHRDVGRIDTTIDLLNEVLRERPDFLPANLWLFNNYMLTGKTEEADALNEHIGSILGKGRQYLMRRAIVHGARGDVTAFHETIKEADALQDLEYINPIMIATTYVYLGDHEQAIGWLERGEREQAWLRYELHRNPVWEPLWDLPRFWDIVERLGLPTLPSNYPAGRARQRYEIRKAAEAALAAQPKPVRRYSIELPANRGLPPGGLFPASRVAVSPDGAQFVYASTSEVSNTRLVRRRFDAWDFEVVEGTEDSSGPVFSPDGSWVAFGVFAERRLKRVSMISGQVEALGTVGSFISLTWSDGGGIFFLDRRGADTVYRLRPGDVEVKMWITSEDAEMVYYNSPHALPGERGVLLAYQRKSGDSATSRIAVFDAETEELTLLPLEGQRPKYVESGHMIFSQPGALMAVPFDLDTLTVQGPPVDVTEPNMSFGNAYPYDFDVAGNGTLIYAMTGASRGGAHDLVTVDFEGNEHVVGAGNLSSIGYPLVSPDGSRIAVSALRPGNLGTGADIWLLNWGDTSPLRFTFEGGPIIGVWIRNGEEVLYTSAGGKGIYRKRSGGAGEPILVEMSDFNPIPMGWLENSNELLYYHYSETSRRDIAAINLDTGERRALVETPFDEMNPTVSRDGKWLAYDSDESGAYEIYVRPYPDVDGGKWVVSVSGGREPLWAPDGSELYYRDGTSFVAVPIDTSSGFSAGRPQVLFPDRYGRIIARNYDITPDGKKFVVTKAASEDVAGHQNRIFVVENWTEELKRLAPHPEAN